MKNSFLMYYQNYCKICEENKEKDGTAFYVAAFEYKNNCATGLYQYSSLLNQLQSIKLSIDNETSSWILNGPSLLFFNIILIIINNSY